MGASGMGVDANGKPIKRQAPATNINKKPGNNQNQKKGNNNSKNNRNQHRGGGNQNQHRPQGHQQKQQMVPPPLIPPFAPIGPGAFMGGPPGTNFNFFNGRRSGGGKNNGNRNGAPQQGYNGPSAHNVGQGSIGNSLNMHGPGIPDQSAMEVPGFGKNSNIHELFGKMIWRKMEQIQDPAVVDQLQNRIMNLIHDVLAGQNEQQQAQQQGFNQQRGMPFGAPTNQKGPAFANNTAGFQRF
ncbi:unnamed protein product [Caenorhabditis sp. 36 PRJEB53466]|nr:unnamed protein product [Caenorhabditis sp. 36 PRJEB53466]